VDDDPRARTLLRMRRLMALAAAGAAADACQPHSKHPGDLYAPMPYETQPYQASDPVPNPPMREPLPIQVDAKRATSSWTDAIELRIHPTRTPLEMRVLTLDGATLDATTVDGADLVLRLVPLGGDAGAATQAYVQIELKLEEGSRIAVVSLGLAGPKDQPIPITLGE
jgi:hypothetical protein